MSDKVGHFEIPADNTDRARKFYQSVFGWTMNHDPKLDYTIVRTGPTDAQGRPTEPGYIGGGIAKRGGSSMPLKHPAITIVVEEILTVEKSIETQGGKVLQRKQPIGDGSMGYMGYFQDTEGNVIGLYQMPTPAPKS